MSNRTTHSDLAELLRILAHKLEAVPAAYLVGDASTRGLLMDAARILVEQDLRIGKLTVGLREIGTKEARDVIVRAQI